MNKKNYTSDEIKDILERASISYSDEITLEKIVAFLSKDEVFGNDVKNFTKECDIYDKKIKTKIENIERIKSCITIDGFDTDNGQTDNENSEEAITRDDSDNQTDSGKKAESVENSYTEILSVYDMRQKYEELLNNNKIQETKSGNNGFDVSANKSIYKGLPVNFEDGLYVKSKNNKLSSSFLIMVSIENNNVVASGRLLEKEPHKYYMEYSEENIVFVYMNTTKYRIIVADSEKKETYYMIDFNVSPKEMPFTDKPLCIDFGTSNTTMGSYGVLHNDDSIEFVEFADITKPSHEMTTIYPTMVYVKKCSENGNEYLFGYEAKKKLIDSDYNPEGTMFFEIKRWITSDQVTENIVDEDGTPAKVKRGEIIECYLRHIIQKATQHFKFKFKKLHFSAPVKLKNTFIELTKNFFKDEYIVLDADESIDEGIAIIYNHISERIKSLERKNKNNENKKILIVDCGGGTTDLASCDYALQKDETGYNLKIETKFENGNSNFGGNNITFKLFQLLKIKLADFYNNYNLETNNSKIIPVKISDIIEPNADKILNIIDSFISNPEQGKKLDIYSQLNQKSDEAEKILPTEFNSDSVFASESGSKRHVKRNFNYLWQLAEKVKIEFFNQTDLMTINFENEIKSGKKIVIDNDSSLYFYVVSKEDSEELVKRSIVPKIEINTREITELLRPAIYYLMDSIFNTGEDNKNIDFDKIDHFKLSGQSCKITLFNELLREFIPGKKLRLPDEITEARSFNKSSKQMKLECISGSIAYIRDKDKHIIKPKISVSEPNLTYEIEEYKNEAIHEVIFSGKNNEPVKLRKFDVTDGSVELKIYDTNGIMKCIRSLSIPLSCNSDEKIDLNAIVENFKKKSCIADHDFEGKKVWEHLRDELDSLDPQQVNKKDEVLVLFVFPNKEGYDFSVFEAIKKSKENKETYSYSFYHVYNFEDGLMSQSFFNGKKIEEGDF